MKRETTLFLLGLLMSYTSFGQMSRTTLVESGYNLMNPNVIRCSDSTGYLISASAVKDSLTSRAWLTKIDNLGGVVWSQSYQLGSGTDTRCYGLVEHQANQSFMLTGYFTDQFGMRVPYVLEVTDPNGVIKNMAQLDFCSNVYSGGPCHGYGLDLMIDAGNHVVVSGFADQTQTPSQSSLAVYGIVAQLDWQLQGTWVSKFESFITCSPSANVTNQYPMANRAVQIPGDRYLITGSVGDEQFEQGRPFQTQVVLAANMDNGGNIHWTNPYSLFPTCSGGSDDFHVGVDAWADNNNVYLFSNFSNAHSFNMSVMDATTGTMKFSKTIIPADNYWAHTVLQDRADTNYLIVAGVRHDNVAPDIPFTIRISKVTGEVHWSNEYLVNSFPTYLQNYGQGDDRLIAYEKVYQPFIEYPDMITYSNNAGYILVTNRVDDPSLPIAIEVLELGNGGEELVSNCSFYERQVDTINDPLFARPVTFFTPTPNSPNPVMIANNPESPAYIDCIDPLPTYSPKRSGGLLGLNEQNGTDQLELYPNPVNTGSELTIRISTPLLSARILDVAGKEVQVLSDLNSEQGGYLKLPIDLKRGTYFLEGKTETEVFKTQFIVNQ
ncbi:T9SS type A sorting domain-containing protein [bacterium SCSIO 12741]|nr:T9SS type A sorting domain-containing protein [bacterium SCSIO 12741]